MSIQKKLDKMTRIEKPVFEMQNIKFNFKDTQRSGFNVIKGSEIYKSFEYKIILNDAALNVSYGEKVALIGPNGTGKTTFIKMLLGKTTIDSGTLEIGANVKYAYLPQEITFNNEEDLLIECFRENRTILEGKAREYLSKFMFFGKTVYKKVKHLSGGERVRLKLSMLLYDEINLLILDEPTNHLDINSIEALEIALEDFNGTIFFISHDRYFINKVCNRVLCLEGNKLVSYEGNYDFYKNKKSELTLPVSKIPSTLKKKSSSKNVNDDIKKRKSEFDKIEASIESLENELAELNKLIDNTASNYNELITLYSKKEQLNEELDKIITVWENFDINKEANNL